MKRFFFLVLFLVLLAFRFSDTSYAATCAAGFSPTSNVLSNTTLSSFISNTTASREYEVSLTKTGSSTPLYTGSLEATSDNEVLTFEIPLSDYPVEAGEYTFAARDMNGGNCMISQNNKLTVTGVADDRCPTFTGYIPFPAVQNDTITLEFNRGGQNATKDFSIQVNGTDTYVLTAGARKLVLQRYPVGSYSFTVSSSPGRNDCPEGVFDISPPECRREGNDCDTTNPCCAGFTCREETSNTAVKKCRPQQLTPNNPPLLTPPCAGGQCNTAFGIFSVGNVGQFVSQVFQLVLAIGGAGAVLLIIYAGFLFMVSRGDKERIANARQIMTASIGGLIFIILSFAILSFIGNTVLNLPGF